MVSRDIDLKRSSWKFQMPTLKKLLPEGYFPTDIYLFKINNGKTIAMCELYSKLTIKTPERRH